MARGCVWAGTVSGAWMWASLALLLVGTGCELGPDRGREETPAQQTLQAMAPAPALTTQTMTLEPIADATVDATRPDTPLGSERKLVVDHFPERRSYLRFSPGKIEGTVTHAVLRLYAVDPSVQGPVLYGTSSDWDEATLTWNSAPEVVQRLSDPVADRVPDESWVEYNVTWHVQKGGESFALSSLSRDGVDFVSRDSPDKAHHPQLVITWVPPVCDPGSAPSVITVAPTFDTWVDPVTPDTGYAAAPELLVRGSPRRESFLFFDVNTGGQPIAGTRLRLYVTDPTNDDFGVYHVRSAWMGEDFGWASRPSYAPGFWVGWLGNLAAGWMDASLSQWMLSAEGRHGFALASSGNDTVAFISSEGDAAFRPQFLVGMGVESCSYRGRGISGTTQWWKGVGGSGQEVLRAAASSSTGEPILAGTWSGADSTWGGATLPGGGGLALARLHTDGTVAWSRGFGAQDVDVHGVAVTPTAGDILVLGEYDGTVDFGTGPLPTEAPGARKLFIARFGPDGTPLWSRGFTAWREVAGSRLPVDVSPRAIVTDTQGAVWVTGFFTGTLDLGGGAHTASAGDALTPGMFVAKFTADGTYAWSRAVPGVEGRPTQGLTMAMDRLDVVVGGTLADGTELGIPGAPRTASRPFVARFSRDTGALRWRQVFWRATGKVTGVAASEGNVYFTGQFQGYVDSVRGSALQSGAPDGFVAYFEGLAERPSTIRAFGTEGADDEGRQVVVAGDYLWVTGVLGAGADFLYLGDLEPGPFVAIFSISGATVAVRNLAWNAPPSGLTLLNEGSVLVGGSVQAPARIDGQTYTPRGASDLLLMKLRR
ncbi:DNRLRE domain-containing protein [Myxococcaceae bacterium GXIMD 01537]